VHAFIFSLDCIMQDRVILLHGIIFYSSPSGAFSYLFEGERLGLQRLGLGYEDFFLAIERDFMQNICCVHKS